MRHTRERRSVFFLPDEDARYSAEKEFVIAIQTKEL